MKQPQRTGLTLIEVLLATAILAMALTALSQLQAVGGRAAIEAELECEAVLLCQSRLDELLAAGITKEGGPRRTEAALATGSLVSGLLATGLEPLADAPGWSHRVLVQPTAIGSLQSVTVEIYRQGLVQRSGAVPQPVASLTRWARMPSAPPAPGGSQ